VIANEFMGTVPFREALCRQDEILKSIHNRQSEGRILGFECPSTVTLGIRASAADLGFGEAALLKNGIEIQKVDRGGQATLHNPGQLVLFPVLPIQALGARNWVCELAKATVQTLHAFGIDAQWREESPGVYTANGKIASIGIRIRRGVSTHGVSINVRNDLAPFQWIRTCGIEGRALDKMGDNVSLEDVFRTWCEALTLRLNSLNFRSDLQSCEMRS
jgi:lipoate-protein ligase B